MWRVLRQHDFALLWLGGLLSIAGNWAMVVGLPLYVYDQTGSTLATAATFITSQVPQVLFASVAGVFADRWDRKRTLVVTNLVLAGVLVGMLAAIALDALWLVYFTMFAVASLQQLVTPAEDALLPRLIGRPEDLVTGNALNALNNNIARLAGPAVGAAVYSAAGLTAVVIADMASFLAAALLISRVRAHGRPDRAEVDDLGAAASAWSRSWSDWIAGVRMVRTRRTVAVLIVFAALSGLGEGAMMALIVPFVDTVLEADDSIFGVILSVQAVGSLVGGVIIGQFAGRVSPRRLLGFGSLGLAALDVAIFVYPAWIPGPWPAVGLFLVVGLPVSALFVGLTTMRQIAVPDAFRARMRGGYGTTQALTMTCSTLLAGTLGEFVPIVPVLLTLPAAYAVGGALVLWAIRPTETDAGVSPPSARPADPAGTPAA